MLLRTPPEQRAKSRQRSAGRFNELLRAAVPLLLRISLGATFVWFGGLKLADEPTLLVPLLRPDVAFLDGNPLLLSVEGEYVVKNLVLLAATASLALHSLGTQPKKARGLRFARDGASKRGRPTEGAA